jgi:hypothetical protein
LGIAAVVRVAAVVAVVAVVVVVVVGLDKNKYLDPGSS